MFLATSKLITNYRNKTNEVKFVCNALRDNDYPDWLLNKVKKEITFKKVNKSDRIRKEKYNYVGLPYIKGLNDKMSIPFISLFGKMKINLAQMKFNLDK